MSDRYRALLRLLAYMKPHWMTVTVGALLACAVAATGGLIAWLVKPVMDEIFLKRDLHMLAVVPLALLGAYILKGLGTYGESYLMASVGERVIARLRAELYAHIQGMPLSFFSSFHSGELRARVVVDVSRVAGLASGVLVNTVRRFATSIALLVVMFIRDRSLALIAASVLPLVGVVNWVLGRKLYRINRRAQELVADVTVFLQESFTGIKIVKAFGRESLQQARFDSLNDRRVRLALRDVRVDELSGPLMEILAAVGIVGTLWYGGSRVIAGALTPGEFFSFTAAVVLLYRPIRELFRTFNTVQQSIASVERVFEILDVPRAIVDAPGARTLSTFSDRIAFEAAGFRYPGAEDWALRDISLTVRKGEVVAFVGMSGAGKTTLMELLLRFHDVSAGRITIDGYDLREVSGDSLRALIGVVSQDTFLFQNSIGFNIAYGKPGATHEEIEQAARLAQAMEFITVLPGGLATQVGERGVRLSGGQAQRLTIARAFLRNPPILILDEATSDLDAESEFLVQQALAGLMRGRTVLLIAHRLATVKRADRVVVVDGGRIVEIGRHAELMARTDGIYRGLARRQMLE
ncbi:MAG TPA: ABC transporter ATP-binding protein [Candidatus Nitrosotalea sp.]|nr:ABC transporter ATP-binding protein [Candidatus Nitrosotalea sp.]